MKKLIFIAFLAIAGISILNTQNVNAATIFDNYRTTQTLTLDNSFCEPQDFTYDWRSTVVNLVTLQDSDRGGDVNAAIGNADSYYWYVTQTEQNADKRFSVYYTRIVDTKAPGFYSFGKGYGTPTYANQGIIQPFNGTPTNWYIYEVALNNSCNPVLSNNGDTSFDNPYTINGVQTNEFAYKIPYLIPSLQGSYNIANSIFIAAGDFIAPDDFEGQTPPDSIEEPIEIVNLNYTIDFSVAGSGKFFTAKYLSKTTDPTSSLPDPTDINWGVLDLSVIDNTQPYGYNNICQNILLPVDTPFTYIEHCQNSFTDIDSSHQYAIVANIGYGLSTQELTWDGVNYFIYYKAKLLIVPLHKNNYTINTPGATCANSNAGDYGLGDQCEEPPCNQSSVVCWLTNQSSNTHGVASIVTAPLNALAALATEECYPLVFPFPFTGQQVSLSCMGNTLKDWLGSIYTAYTIILNGVITYWVLVNIFSTIKNIKDPQNDQIEVMKL